MGQRRGMGSGVKTKSFSPEEQTCTFHSFLLLPNLILSHENHLILFQLDSRNI